MSNVYVSVNMAPTATMVQPKMSKLDGGWSACAGTLSANPPDSPPRKPQDHSVHSRSPERDCALDQVRIMLVLL